jgi:hypothetical protein
MVIKGRMIIPTLKPPPPSPNHRLQIQHHQIIQDLAILIGPARDVEEVVYEDDCGAGTGFRGGTSGGETGPGVGAGVEGVDVVWVGATVVFAAVDEEDVGAPEGG